jgi:NAD(P)-dependent dehydrogenase (short-subunit alcohol dehydrogenase family)
MTKVLAKELGPAGIRVNAIAPGLVETRFSAALFQNRPAYERLMAQTPLGRHGQPEDVVGAALFLASDASAYVTGQVLVVDGGARM